MRSPLAACAVVLLLTACGGSDPVVPPTDEPDVVRVGSYALSSVGGRALPFTYDSTAERSLFIVAETLVLRADGTCSRIYEHAQRIGTRVVPLGWTGPCTWAQRDDAVLLTIEFGTVVTGLLEDRAISFPSPSGPFRFVHVPPDAATAR